MAQKNGENHVMQADVDCNEDWALEVPERIKAIENRMALHENRLALHDKQLQFLMKYVERMEHHPIKMEPSDRNEEMLLVLREEDNKLLREEIKMLREEGVNKEKRFRAMEEKYNKLCESMEKVKAGINAII